MPELTSTFIRHRQEDPLLSGYSKSGKGSSIGHGGEILQGALWRDHELEPFLVTLPAPPFVSRATVFRSCETEDQVEPAWTTKALKAARIAWTQMGGCAGSLRLVIESQTPVGRGCGSSTSDCVAAIRAVSNLVGYACSSEEIALWSVRAEAASDATMFDLRPIAFRQREGRVLRMLGSAFPSTRVVIADLGGPAVDTVTRPMPLYSSSEIATFGDLLTLLEESVDKQDSRALARVASESAAISQRYYPHPRWPDFASATRRADVLGVGCAHSGSLGVALLAPSQTRSEEQLLAELACLALPVVATYTLDAGPKGDG